MALSGREALDIWRGALVASVRGDESDLSARQFAVMLLVYTTEPPHTVRGLAGTLNVSKPAITRALDRLGGLDFTRRKRDQADGRNVLIQRTVKGSVFLSEFSDFILAAESKAQGGG